MLVFGDTLTRLQIVDASIRARAADIETGEEFDLQEEFRDLQEIYRCATDVRSKRLAFSFYRAWRSLYRQVTGRVLTLPSPFEAVLDELPRQSVVVGFLANTMGSLARYEECRWSRRTIYDEAPSPIHESPRMALRRYLEGVGTYHPSESPRVGQLCDKIPAWKPRPHYTLSWEGVSGIQDTIARSRGYKWGSTYLTPARESYVILICSFKRHREVELWPLDLVSTGECDEEEQSTCPTGKLYPVLQKVEH